MNEKRQMSRWGRPLLPPALLRDSIHVNGHIRVRELPFDTEQEWRHWWLGEFNNSGQMVRVPRMSEREKERYTAAESHNILVSTAITQLLNFLGLPTGNGTLIAQQFAVGSVAINQVQSSDTSVAGEYFRAAPSASNVSGVQIDISTLAGTTQANGIITNCGLFGGGATGTIGSGSLMTHSLFNYIKTSSNSVSFDYLLSYA